MSRLRAAERIRGVRERISRRTEHIVSMIRSGCSAVDIWIQDHYRFTVISMLLTLAAGTALLEAFLGRPRRLPDHPPTRPTPMFRAY